MPLRDFTDEVAEVIICLRCGFICLRCEFIRLRCEFIRL